ncbi:YceI family protein [[Mycobacterium] nativiensis]|uniref:YceI family protein n=1 Tax=[Mycobacterium] nativiensis TaxID=2855503 RepID=A0ABU5XRH3_9MYCO|nr:YceI family protein [Mycolicibacter sp. MYC340]MEB3030574.1 YceI family protein [Mycolicibacter sp. MYC340]
MAETQGQFDESHGRLLLGTDVAGRAAKMGHRLMIAMERWQAAVSWSGARPTSVTLTVDVDALRVLRGDGGLTPLTPPEKALIRGNALKCLESAKYERIRFESNDIEPTDDGYRLTGTLEIHGRTKPHMIEVRVGPPHEPGGSARLDGGEPKLGPPHEPGGSWQVDGDSRVRQSDFGVRRFSMLMGAMQVADEVTVSFSATVPADEVGG